MFSFKDGIAVPSHKYSTQLMKVKSNVIVPKIKIKLFLDSNDLNTSLWNFAVITI